VAWKPGMAVKKEILMNAINKPILELVESKKNRNALAEV
jgi:hypothetical protein